MLAAEGYPFVYVGRRDIPGVDMSYVTADYAGAVRAALDLVAATGHERIAYLASADLFGPLLERQAAFREGVAALGLEGSLDVVDPPESFDAERLRALVAGGATAIFVEIPEVGRALVVAAEVAGLAIPRDLTVVALDHADNPMPWSRLAIPRREMGVRAVELLLELLDDPERTARRAVLPCGPLEPLSIAPPAPTPPPAPAAPAPMTTTHRTASPVA